MAHDTQTVATISHSKRIVEKKIVRLESVQEVGMLQAILGTTKALAVFVFVCQCHDVSDRYRVF